MPISPSPCTIFNMNSNNIHSTRQEGNFKEIHCRTKIKYMCISVNGPKVWNNLDSSLKKFKTFQEICLTSMSRSIKYVCDIQYSNLSTNYNFFILFFLLDLDLY